MMFMINTEVLTEAEVGPARQAFAHLSSAEKSLERIRVGVEMFMNSEAEAEAIVRDNPYFDDPRSKKLRIVADIAARDVMMTTEDFRKYLTYMKNSLDACPSVRQLGSCGKIASLVKDFHKEFPDTGEARVAAAHPADIRTTPKRNRSRREISTPDVRAPAQSVLLQSIVAREGILNTVEGKLLVSSVNLLLVERLASYLDGAEKIYSEISEWTKKLYFEGKSFRK